uniref:Cytochrome P450 n=1 Tax=Timema douglasi TaxID=61478 RepID=A0A7R8ZC54_TIMDO|nr:unnamed protein product [Timema douglasi]
MLGTGLPLIGNLHLMNILLYPLVVISGILFLYHTIQQRSRRFTLGNMIPGPPGLPLLGNALDLCTAQAILGSSVHIDKPGEYGFFKRWFGNGLLISTGEIWKTHRKLIAPTFHLHVLKSFITQLNTHSNILVERLNKQVGGKSFDVHDYVAESTVDILLGKQSILKYLPTLWHQDSDGDGSQSEGTNKQHFRLRYRCHEVFKTKKEEYLRHKLAGVNREIGDLSDVTQAATKGTYFDQSRGLKDDLDDDVAVTLAKPSVEGLNLAGEQRDPRKVESLFLTCLCLRDTTQYPLAPDKVLQELDEIFGDSDRPATFNDTLNMKYLERVILETLRMFPPVPMIGRLIKEEIKLPSGYILPAETTVVIAQLQLHRRPEIYPDPEEFNPDNFLPENMNNRHYYAYIPFSAGPRRLRWSQVCHVEAESDDLHHFEELQSHI